ncbi:hypothetical protein Tco_0582865 [Tanacetum coccineum]
MLAIQAEEGEGSGHPSEPQSPPSTAQPTNEEPIPNVPIPNVPDEAIYEEWDDRVERATTTVASLDAEQASGGSPRGQEAMGGSIAQTRSKRVPIPPCDSPLSRVHTLRSDKGSEKLEKIVKTSHSRRRAKIIVSDDEEALEDSSKQGRMIEEIDEDAGVTLVTHTQGEDQPEYQLGVLSAAKVLTDAAKTNVHTYTRRRRPVSTGSGGIISTAGMVQEVNVSIPSPVVIKDKGKGKMKESEDEQIKRTKLHS